MSFGSILYNIFIGPLELGFEVIYTIANRFINNYGLSIIVLSLLMNFLVLPLYRRADAMQEEERDVEARLHDGIAHINKTFKGDEKMMMLQTYYRQNHYKPTDVFKNSISLFLEIPFFIAAYRFLSGLSCLQGVSFGPIADLGAQDGLIAIAGFHINLLPIIMTAVNLVSCVIFTKGFPKKTKIQLYGMAIFFLIFLYKSPSGLVFYWTLNNLFSLVKTIFYKLKNPKLVLSILAALAGAFCMVFGLFISDGGLKLRACIVLFGLALLIPIFLYKFGDRLFNRQKEYKPNRIIFISGALFLTFLMGGLIPSTFIKASPLEFVDLQNYVNPTWYIISALCTAAGLFLVWMQVFYGLADKRGKCLFEKGIWVVAICGIVNYMFFRRNTGIIYANLTYAHYPECTAKEQIINLGVLILVAAATVALLHFLGKYVKGLFYAGVVALAGMSIFNIVSINKTIGSLDTETAEAEIEESTPNWNLSTNGKNVVVIMLDRGMGEYIPYLLNEDEELQEQFAGFTYYENVISYGGYTNFATPALFGGYEYTPYELNQKTSQTLEEKQNEALKVMPVLFDQNGYEVTVCDPTYANYQWIADTSIYDDYPDITAYNAMAAFYEKGSNEAFVENDLRNFFCFSFMKSMPACIQSILYSDGSYNKSARTDDPVSKYTFPQKVNDSNPYVSEGVTDTFMNSYNELDNLPTVTNITSEGENTFLMLTNDMTHDVMSLSEPDYEPAESVDNTAYEEANQDRFTVDGVTLECSTGDQLRHYQSNMAALQKLGDWFDYLRENGAWDNTRIIVVSDHGRDLGQNSDLILTDELDSFGDTEMYFPMLLVKDFDSNEFTTSDQFMTNADVPTLAMSDLITDPVNPFTGNAINSDEKTAHPQYVFGSNIIDVTVNNGTAFLPGIWLEVDGDDARDMSNWTVLQTNSTSPFEETN